MKSSASNGHFAALFTALVWGTTFISTKILLAGLQPVEILFLRFVLGLLALLAFCPKRFKGTTARQELTFAAAGLCGVCLYYLLENIALTCTLASNVSVIVSVSPFFTAILSRLVTKEEKLRPSFFLGFALAMTGIVLISLPGDGLGFDPLGDLLALLAALFWACYSLLSRRIGGFGYPTMLTTRRIFCYGILFMIPALFFFDFQPELSLFLAPVYLLNLLYLGLCASALCFFTWNKAVELLGPVKTSVYLYLVPVITLLTSALVLDEKLTLASVLGTLLTLAGLFLSQHKSFSYVN